MNLNEEIQPGKHAPGGVGVSRIGDCADIDGWLRLAAGKPYPALLDSSLYDGKYGCFSILCWRPYKKITLQNGRITVTDWRARSNRIASGNPFQLLSHELEKERIHGPFPFPLPFAGGAIGYFSYDLRHSIESLPALCNYDLKVPEFILCFYDRALVFDHKTGSAFLVGGGPAEIEKLLAEKHAAGDTPPLAEKKDGGDCLLHSNFSSDSYKYAVKKAIDYIGAGDIFQANLSQRFQGRCSEDGLRIYQRLRSINPAPFSAFLRYPKFDIISSSPERFLLLDGDRVSTRPIKGTRPRREGDKSFNRKMKEELLASEKDHAELAMIVDLERNDLGRVCSYGSVNVGEHAVLETYPTVYHLVSTVEGRLYRPRFNEIDLLRAAFPGGSITGAPKIRAMEIIEELEPVARNIYTGSIGYFSLHGRMDLNILIRTMILINGNLYMQVGGGIVADSDPEAEYRETIYKGEALFRSAAAGNYAELMSEAP